MFAKSTEKLYTGYIKKLLNTKALQWQLVKRTGDVTNKAKYNSIGKQCIAASNMFHSDNELILIDNGNREAFYKYVNNWTSFKSGIAPLKDGDGVVQNEDSIKARIVSQFASNFTIDNHHIPEFNLHRNANLEYKIT